MRLLLDARGLDVGPEYGSVKSDMHSSFGLIAIGVFLLGGGGFCFWFPHRIQNFDMRWRERAFRDAKRFGGYVDLVKGPEYRFFIKYGGFVALVIAIIILVQGVSLLIGYDIILGIKASASVR
jgi:hypothetical protein